MAKVIPFVSEWTKRAMIVDALLALCSFEEEKNREEFKKWKERWKEELLLLKKAEKANG